MQLSPKKIKTKIFHRAAQRIDEIHREMLAIPPVPLPKKIMVGHWRYFRVREDVLRSSVGDQVKQVTDRCNHWVLGKKKDPDSYRSSTEIAVSPSASTFYSGQRLRPLNHEQFVNSNFPDFFEKKWFRVVELIHRAGTKNIPIKRYFPQVPPHMLEFAYKPAYMTEENLPSSPLTAELHHLYDFMKKNHGWERLSGRHADEWDLNLTRTRILDKLSRREAESERRQSLNNPTTSGGCLSPLHPPR